MYASENHIRRTLAELAGAGNKGKAYAAKRELSWVFEPYRDIENIGFTAQRSFWLEQPSCFWPSAIAFLFYEPYIYIGHIDWKVYWLLS